MRTNYWSAQLSSCPPCQLWPNNVPPMPSCRPSSQDLKRIQKTVQTHRTHITGLRLVNHVASTLQTWRVTRAWVHVSKLPPRHTLSRHCAARHVRPSTHCCTHGCPKHLSFTPSTASCHSSPPPVHAGPMQAHASCLSRPTAPHARTCIATPYYWTIYRNRCGRHQQGLCGHATCHVTHDAKHAPMPPGPSELPFP